MSPPSSPDGIAGLLAAARRRLPADVDVVGLAGGMVLHHAWRLRPVYPDQDEPVTLEAVRDGVDVQVSGCSSQRFVLFDISGSLAVGDLDDEFLSEEAEILTFG